MRLPSRMLAVAAVAAATFAPAAHAAPDDATWTPSASKAKIVQVALDQVGVTERPARSNRAPQIRRYWQSVPGGGRLHGTPWGAAFISWVADQAGAPIGHGHASIRGIVRYAAKHDLLVRGQDVEPGDILLLDGMRQAVIVVAGPGENGRVKAVGGNDDDSVNVSFPKVGRDTVGVRIA